MTLLAFECRFSSMEPVLRRNFGFLFTYRGRAAFLFFVGCVDFGMNDNMAWLAGLFMCINVGIDIEWFLLDLTNIRVFFMFLSSCVILIFVTVECHQVWIQLCPIHLGMRQLHHCCVIILNMLFRH